MKIVITRLRDDTFVVSHGWELHNVKTPEEASAIVATSSSQKYKNVLDILRWNCENGYDMLELSGQQTVSRKVNYSEMF